MKNIFLCFAILILKLSTISAQYNYKLIEKDNRKIHYLEIDPSEYEVKLVAANDQVFGRKKLGDIVDNHGALIGINAGFFEINNNQDAKASGTLISDGKLYGLRVSEHGCLVKKQGKFYVENIKPYLIFNHNETKIIPKKYNRFIKNENYIYYFNEFWGDKTPAVKHHRYEIILDKNNVVIKISSHSENQIPRGGVVLSLPQDFAIDQIKLGQKFTIISHPEYLLDKGNFVVMGIPSYLVKGNVIHEQLNDSKISARTAVGVKKGKLIFVVIEHIYIQNYFAQAIKNATNINNKDEIKNYKTQITNSLDEGASPKGVSLNELANIMKNFGCSEAINLDGGGSSSLYINGEYINKSMGDVDEGLGQMTYREVSDAIIINKKN